MSESRYYGVSYGNGNDGVSQLFPKFIVKTDAPWELARLATKAAFKPGEGEKWAEENMTVDGDAEYTISATLYEGPDGETHFEAAWFICEVFPMDVESVDSARCLVFESLEEAF